MLAWVKAHRGPGVAVALVCALLALATAGAHAQDQGGAPQAQAPVVNAIVIQGNVEISTDRILEQVTASKVGEPLDREKVQQDVNRIAEMGYFANVEAVPAARSGGVELTFVVTEFPVVRSFTVEVAEGVVSESDVKALFSVRVGEILNARLLGDELDALPIKSGEVLGYVLRPTDVGFRGEQGDELYLAVTPVRVGKVRLEGNEKTKDHVILRELPFKEGDILSMDQVRTGLMKLGQLGYFEPIVPEFLTTSDPLVVDILLPIVESKTGRAAFGGGYSSQDGLIGYVEVADDNFLGRGERAQVKWEFGRNKNTYDLGFYEPYLFGRNISAGINLYNTLNRRQFYKDGDYSVGYPYTVRRVGGDITLGRPLGTFTRGSLTLKVENAAITPDTDDGVVEESRNNTRSIIARTRTDTTDHLYFPTLGYRADFTVETAGRFLGGDTEFTKFQTALSRFAKAGRNNQTWAFRVMAGYSLGTLPLQEQFAVGGADTVRGYRFGEMRGDRMVVAQAEYRFPISTSVQGVVFADAGNAWEQQSIDLGNLKFGYGVGIRFSTPLGVMRVDYGIGENGGNAYFSLGPSF